ncbi:iron complex outermembrane receptor protein [Povalibacter uvarum]|uniref:Iron complex outermembrane receptor protein n=1 Tax=Povalibacter uvarum TaxID=732238 RepID=A0A841HW63_9GAMM|nr:TonB-dependent receptor [Povalibacter uvarum]MBB6096489.1 iron complex outermembrane receptor protein [Povalibacter uvarum]
MPADDPRLHFEIQNQSLTSALREFSTQGKVHLLYSSEAVDAHAKASLRGYFTVRDGLAKLLADSDLEFVIDDQGNVAIRRRPRAVQPVPVPAEESPSAPPRVAGDDVTHADVAIAEVTVTARRREESLQQVPLAVSSMGAQEIEVRDIQNAEDLNARVPGVAVNGGNFFGRTSGAMRVRGIPGVAVYVDDVVRSGANGLLMNVVEVERIEVLRGPQGTMFGKNAMGGAIQYVTQKPRTDPGIRVKATGGSAGRRDFVLNTDLPLTDTLFSKLTAATLNRDGYIDSTTVDADFGDQNDRIMRADLQWRPHENLSALLIGEYAEQRNDGTPAAVWALNPVCPGSAPPVNFVGGVPNSLCIYEAVGLPLDSEWTYGARKEWKTASPGSIWGNSYTSAGGVLQVEWEMSDQVRLKSITGYRDIDVKTGHDFDGTPYAIYEAYSASRRTESSQELQLQFRGERLTGTSGLYYYADDNRSSRQNWVANELRFDPWLSAREALGGGYASYDPPLINTLTDIESRGWAVFAEWSWRQTSRLTLSLGARYNSDEIHQASYLPAFVQAEQCCNPSDSLQAAGDPLPNQSGTATFNRVSPRASIQYQWTPRIMTYFTRAHGFGAGGFTGGNVPFLPNGGFTPYGPEDLANNELGLRADLFGGRLRFNATAFFGIYDDVQITEELQEAPGFPRTTNAGEAQIRGFEIEGSLQLSRSLLLQYGATWLHTEFTEIGNAENLALGAPFAYAPRFAYSFGAQYDWRLQPGNLSLRADYAWQDDVQTQLDINTRSFQPAYGVMNARMAFASPDNRWEFAIFGTNVLNQFYRINGFFLPADQIDTGTPARPREWGMSLRYATH